MKVSLMTKDPARAKRATGILTWPCRGTGRPSAPDPARPLSQKEIQALAGITYRSFVDAFDNNPGLPKLWEHILRRNVEAGGGGGSLLIGTLEERQNDEMEKRCSGIVDAILRARGGGATSTLSRVSTS